jgi:hypothetical protein
MAKSNHSSTFPAILAKICHLSVSTVVLTGASRCCGDAVVALLRIVSLLSLDVNPVEDGNDLAELQL